MRNVNIVAVIAARMNSSRMCNFDMTSEHFPAVPGPLCHSVRDCVEFFKIQNISNGHLSDPFRPTIPFNEKTVKSF